MAGNVFTIRLSDEERQFLGQSASEAGLPVGTFMKRVVLGQMDRDRLADEVARERAEREAEREIWFAEIKNILFIKGALLQIAKAQSIDLNAAALDERCEEAVKTIFEEKFGG